MLSNFRRATSIYCIEATRYKRQSEKIDVNGFYLLDDADKRREKKKKQHKRLTTRSQLGHLTRDISNQKHDDFDAQILQEKPVTIFVNRRIAKPIAAIESSTSALLFFVDVDKLE